MREPAEPEEINGFALVLLRLVADRQAGGVDDAVHDLEVGRHGGGVDRCRLSDNAGDGIERRSIGATYRSAERNQLAATGDARIDVIIDDAGKVDRPAGLGGAPTEHP